MKITLQPDPKCLEVTRNDKDALKLSINLMKAFGVPEPATQAWDKAHQVEFDPEKPISLLEMTCYFPDEIKDQSEWLWTVEVLDGGRLVWLNDQPFFAKATHTGFIKNIPLKLQNFDNSGWPNESLGPAFKNLSNLKSLSLRNCKLLNNVSELENLTQLTSLDLSRCESLTDVSALGSLPQLTSLNLSGCKLLSDVSVLSSLPQLTSLNLSGCKSLTDVSVLGVLPQLTSLNLSGCKSLTDVSALGSLPQLTSLNLSGCESLTDVSALGSLTQLTSLDLSWCGPLTDVSVLGSLAQLTSLDLSWCGSLTDVSALGSLPQLTSLDLSECESLTDVSVLGSLPQLTSLNLSGCKSLTDVSALGSLPQLTSLNLSGCKSLTDVSALGSLPQLTSLNLSRCESLTNVSALGSLPQLTSLDLFGCESLTDVSALGSLTQLTSLDLSGCESLTDVSALGSLTQLTSLDLFGCESLTDVSALGSLTQLTSLDLSGCHRIIHEPKYKYLSKLQSLNADKHPSQIVDILALCAVSRRDWFYISTKLDDWLTELQNAIQFNHPAATDLAISLAIGISHLENDEINYRFSRLLKECSTLSYKPWMKLFQGIYELSGLQALAKTFTHIPKDEYTSGAIGGFCAIVPLLKLEDAGLSLSWKYVGRIHKNYYSFPGFLRPVAPQWCLALKELKEFQLLDEWLNLFLQMDNLPALDDMYLEKANQALASHDLSGVTIKAAEIRSPRVRDKLLLKIANGYLAEGSYDLAGDFLFRIVHADSRAKLARELANIPGFLENPVNLHRVLAACGNHPEEIQDVISIARNSELDSLKPILKKFSIAKTPSWRRWFSGFFSQWLKTK